jgi:hypothetical protein
MFRVAVSIMTLLTLMIQSVGLCCVAHSLCDGIAAAQTRVEAESDELMPQPSVSGSCPCCPGPTQDQVPTPCPCCLGSVDFLVPTIAPISFEPDVTWNGVARSFDVLRFVDRVSDGEAGEHGRWRLCDVGTQLLV